ncbi:MAG TPA: hypothetical protein VFX15_02815 [Actinomycetes bacterium]|nr:hypothetical protein [Actinomycetes bacterium]
MADNVGYTPGSGVSVSTEEVTTLNGGAVSAQHVQRVANALRTADGTAIDLPGDSTNGLDVDVTRLPVPHASIGTPLSIGLATSSTQTSANLVAGTGGQRIYVTHLTIATAGTTSGRVSIYWGTGAFTAGTSPTLFDGEFKPSSTREAGVALVFPFPVGGASATGDNLRITTSAAMTIYVTGQCYKA